MRKNCIRKTLSFWQYSICWIFYISKLRTLKSEGVAIHFVILHQSNQFLGSSSVRHDNNITIAKNDNSATTRAKKLNFLWTHFLITSIYIKFHSYLKNLSWQKQKWKSLWKIQMDWQMKWPCCKMIASHPVTVSKQSWKLVCRFIRKVY